MSQLDEDLANAESIRPLRPQTTIEDNVYAELRELIVSLQLPPGMRLAQRRVADRLGVSQTPVRVAIGRLRREGLITTKQGRGAIVSHLTRELYEELLAGRLGPEALAARLGAPAVTDRDVDQMVDLLGELRRLASDGSSRAYVKTLWDLHAICYRAVDRPRLLAEVERLFSFGERYSVAMPTTPEIMEQSVQFYSDFVDACRDRDASRAQHAIIAGIDWAWTTLATYFPSERDLP